MSPFRYALGRADNWHDALKECLAGLIPIPAAANLGLVYATDAIADDLDDVLRLLREQTGVEHWVGGVGIGICATGVEVYEQPAIAVMLAELGGDAFRVFGPVIKDLDRFDALHGEWMRAHPPYLGLVHADPTNPLIEGLIRELAERTSTGFVVGGLASARERIRLVADEVTEGGLTGVLFDESVAIQTALSQGCSPIGPVHRISEGSRNLLIKLDDRPALDVFKEDIGEILSRDLMRVGGFIFAGLPITGSDTGDYLVRNLVGVDPNEGLVAIGDLVEPGGRIMFCRRDARTAREDLERMLGSLSERLAGRQPRGAVYVSCLGRGASLFGDQSEELGLIRETLGEVPLVGFYANGEISRDRLYGYTGVLTLFS